VLDALLFGRLKVAKGYQPHDPGLDFQLDHIIQIIYAYAIVTISFNVRGSWNKKDLVRRKEAIASTYT
jgi:hypothetical protein